MKRKLILAVSLLALLSALYPLYFFQFSDRRLPHIPAHHTYQEAVGRLLPDSIKIMAARHKCRGYVLPVEAVSGPDASFPHLKDDINLALSAYDGWRLKVAPAERQKMKKRLEENIKKWGAMLSGSELMRIALTQKAVDAQTQTSVSARWFYRNVQNGDDVKLVVTVNDELKTARLFQISVTFMHPKTLSAWQQKIDRRHRQLVRQEHWAKMSLAACYAFSGLFTLLIVFFLVQSAVTALKDHNMRKQLLIEIGKREELVENGHFVTAYELTEKYLKYFPDDTEIRAFQRRLLDFTNNDPQTAQKAYVEAKKLKNRLSQFADDPARLLLDQQEKSNIQALLPYHPELNTAYRQILQLEESAQKRLNVARQMEEVRSALHAGRPFQAQTLLRQIEEQQPDHPELDQWKEECRRKIEEAQRAYQKVHHLFVTGRLNEAWNALQDFLKQYKDHPQAVQVRNDWQEAEGQTQWKLTWKNQNISLELFLKNELTIGRKDDGARPDLAFDDRRISRQHAALRFIAGQLEIVDNESTGGTYVNGQKIIHAVLKNGDILNLAKIKEYITYLIQDKHGNISGAIFSGKERSWAMIFAYLAFSLKNGKITNEAADWQIFSEGGRAALVYQEEFVILHAGEALRLKEEIIEVEAL